jgi:DUF4097 and DUF4098 domain-containing protein YvlB
MHTYPTDSKTRIVVLNPLGDVRIATDDLDTTTVDLIARGEAGSGAVAEAIVAHEERDGVHVVTIELPGSRAFAKQGRIVDIEVTAPSGSDVRISTDSDERALRIFARRSGDSITLAGSFGDVDVSLPSAATDVDVVAGSLQVRTVSGNLFVRRVDGPAKVRAVSGDVRVDEAIGTLSVAIVSGDVLVAVSHGNVDIASVSGDVVIDAAYAGASCKTTSGDVIVGQAFEGDVRIVTVSGASRIGVAPGRAVSVDARSMSGTLTSEIDLSQDGGSTGSDDPRVSISAASVSGNVTVTRQAEMAGRARSRMPASA